MFHYLIQYNYTVCAQALDATTGYGVNNVTFSIFVENNLVAVDYEVNGEYCIYPILPGTFLTIRVEASGYDDGQKNGIINGDATWVIPMNPLVSTSKVIELLGLR